MNPTNPEISDRKNSKTKRCLRGKLHSSIGRDGDNGSRRNEQKTAITYRTDNGEDDDDNRHSGTPLILSSVGRHVRHIWRSCRGHTAVITFDGVRGGRMGRKKGNRCRHGVLSTPTMIHTRDRWHRFTHRTQGHTQREREREREAKCLTIFPVVDKRARAIVRRSSRQTITARNSRSRHEARNSRVCGACACVFTPKR